MTRSEQIQAAALKEHIYEPKYGGKDHSGYDIMMKYEINYEREEAFCNGAEWADKNPDLMTPRRCPESESLLLDDLDKYKTKLAIAVKALEHYAAKMGKKAVEALAEIKKP